MGICVGAEMSRHKKYNRKALFRRSVRRYMKRIKPIMQKFCEEYADLELNLLYGPGDKEPVGLLKRSDIEEKKAWRDAN